MVTYGNRPHELKFVVYHNGDVNSVPSVFDGQYAARIVEEQSGTSVAFNNVTKNRKVQSLAKFYFLTLMHYKGFKDEVLKAPFNISKTWIEELRSVCLGFSPKVANENTSRKKARRTFPTTRESAQNQHGSSSADRYVIPLIRKYSTDRNRRVRSARLTNHVVDAEERENTSSSSTLSQPPSGLLDGSFEEAQPHTPRAARSRVSTHSNSIEWC